MNEPVKTVVIGQYRIEFYDETDYYAKIDDNVNVYQRTYFQESEYVLPSIVGIMLFQEDICKASCLIGGAGGATIVHSTSMVLNNKQLTICCSDSVFSLALPKLDLEWKTQADSVTCLGIYPLDGDYVVHGELEITRLSKNGETIWQVGGRDIWTTHEGIDDFGIHDDYILATDWNHNRYKIDFNGKIIEEYKI